LETKHQKIRMESFHSSSFLNQTHPGQRSGLRASLEEAADVSVFSKVAG
jgi:hypothetical protein